MKSIDGEKTAEKLRSKGFTISGWARANQFARSSVNRVLYGTEMNGEKGDKIRAALKKDGILVLK